MDAYLTAEMIKAMSEGQIMRGLGFAVVFFFIWLEVKGVRKEIKTLGETIGTSLKKGEERFGTAGNPPVDEAAKIIRQVREADRLLAGHFGRHDGARKRDRRPLDHADAHQSGAGEIGGDP